MEEELYNSFMCTTESPIIQLLEKNLLDLASYSNMTEGVFYVLSLKHGETTMIRLFESGCYSGFFQTQDKLDKSSPTYRVYTSDDIASRSELINQRGNRGECKCIYIEDYIKSLLYRPFTGTDPEGARTPLLRQIL